MTFDGPQASAREPVPAIVVMITILAIIGHDDVDAQHRRRAT